MFQNAKNVRPNGETASTKYFMNKIINIIISIQPKVGAKINSSHLFEIFEHATMLTYLRGHHEKKVCRLDFQGSEVTAAKTDSKDFPRTNGADHGDEGPYCVLL